MLKDFFDDKTDPLITPEAFYGPKGDLADVCLVILSSEIHELIRKNYECVHAADMKACNGLTPIFVFDFEGIRTAFYLSSMGSAVASHQVIESHWLTGADTYIMFGSAGSLDLKLTAGRYIVPSEACRGEGLSYYYAPAADYVDIRGADEVSECFDHAGIPYVKGRVWTTDAVYRETEALCEKRRAEGCIAVDMELAGVQSVCDYHGIRLFDFMETGDVLDGDDYDAVGLDAANHDPFKLKLALEIIRFLFR